VIFVARIASRLFILFRVCSYRDFFLKNCNGDFTKTSDFHRRATNFCEKFIFVNNRFESTVGKKLIWIRYSSELRADFLFIVARILRTDLKLFADINNFHSRIG